MNRERQKRCRSLSMEKSLRCLVKKISENVSVRRNLFLNRETCFLRKDAG